MAAIQDPVDDLLLDSSEVVEAEDAFEDFERVGHSTLRLADRAPRVDIGASGGGRARQDLLGRFRCLLENAFGRLTVPEIRIKSAVIE